MGWHWSAIKRTALMGLGACALLSACTAPATIPVTSTQQQQTDSSRHAYAQMVAQEKSQKDHDGEAGKPSSVGTGATTTSGGISAPTETDNSSGHCTPVTLAASPSSPQVVGVTVTFTGATTNCPNATYEFWMKSGSGNWVVLKGFSTGTTATWQTAGAAAGTYSFDVWAKKPGSSEGSDLHISPILTFTLQPDPVTPPAPTACTSAAFGAPSPSSPQPAGTKVTLSASASGCPSPQYQFWYQPPGGSWTVLQPYGSSSTATWDTSALLAGSYSLDVWVKQSGSSASFEAETKPYPTYTLQTGAPCTSVAWNPPNPASPSAPGTFVTLSAVASGCPSPLYQFWYQSPSGQWTVIRPYSSSSSAIWNTGGLATGTYSLDVWVKQNGSAPASGFEAEIKPYLTYTVQTGNPCTSVTLSFSPTSPSTSGTNVDLTAVATGCPNPTYEFWVQAPGGSWQVMKGYSTNNTALWVTSGLAPGTYLFDVWVRNAGSTTDPEAHISPNPTYSLN